MTLIKTLILFYIKGCNVNKRFQVKGMIKNKSAILEQVMWLSENL